MRERTRPWPTGTPTWADLSADDPVAATASYAELLGWKCVRQDARESEMLLALSQDYSFSP